MCIRDSSLLYRGYPVQELAEHCTFEEVAYLLWNGELPTEEQFAEFRGGCMENRDIDEELIQIINFMPKDCHPMDVLRTAVSYLGAEDPEKFTPDSDHLRGIGRKLLAKLPTIVATDIRRRQGKEYIAPSKEKGFSENFLWMVFGDDEKSPANIPSDIEAFEKTMILYAEHSFNASTFTARVITSTTSDMHSSVAGAIGALKGALHGGANEAVMATLAEVGTADKAKEYIDNALANKQKIMGFGHRVYKNGDSRVPTMRAAFEDMVKVKGANELLDLYNTFEEEFVSRKGIYPNLDYPSGPAYHLMGFDTEQFTPIFVMARITGWTAHIMEQTANNALIRPLSAYSGYDQREVPTDR